MVEKLDPIKLRDVWSDEAKDFTPWLLDNLDLLGEQIGIDLSALEREKSVGTFSADLFATDKAGHRVIIENQLEKTDHDHLGKVLTYLSNLEAKTAIWITSDPRPEHVTAMNYLNEVVPDDTNFYLVRVQAFRIGESEPAPLFTIVAGPSPEIRAVGKEKKGLAEVDKKQREFLSQLIEKSNKKTELFRRDSSLFDRGNVRTRAIKSKKVYWLYQIKKDDANAQLFFQDSDKEFNIRSFRLLKEKQADIEEAFEDKLEWDLDANRGQQYIRALSKIGGLKDEAKWPEIQDALIDRMVRLEKVLRNHIAALT